ncbi:MAG: 1-acyl-sn-glycerol-3-phosphate acyltransferase [Lachnospiraceae bacterium]|nr:1-acyl-sn-glycerol-3-phosphate acyltransferase [Lachnospiraceae bacterium]
MRRIVLMFLANLFRLPYMLFKVFRMSRRRDIYSKEECYAALHRMVRWANRGGRVTVKADGLDKLPAGDGFIMYPNHQGMFDVLTLLEALDRPFSPIAKIETEHVPLLRPVLLMLDTEFMDRSDVRQSLGVITSVANRARRGENFVIFAEGTRSKKENEMLPFKPGAFKAATLSHAPIVPVAFIDCFIPFDRKHIKKVTVQAHILDPIPYDEYRDMNTREIAELVQARIAAKIAEVTADRSK